MSRMRLGLRKTFVLFVVLGMVFPLNVTSAAIVVNTNTQSINALNKLNETNKKLSNVFERISKGLGINKAADDSAGLGVAESMDADYRAVQQALRDTKDGISVIQTAEEAAKEVSNILKRMRELAVQSASETLSTAESVHMQTEFDQLKEEVDGRSSPEETSFNGIDIDEEPVRSPLVEKAEGMVFERLQYINDQVQTISIDDTDSDGETLLTQKWVDKLTKYLATSVTEASRTVNTLVKSSDRTIKAAEAKIKKLEDQRRKASKVKPKPKARQ